MPVKICLDAGHYGKANRSPAVKTYYESEMTWKLHLLLKKYLEEYGFEVITTRADQKKDLGLKKRGETAKGCDLFLSLHSNAVGNATNESVDRPVVIVPISGKGDELGEKLGKCIYGVMHTSQTYKVTSRKGSGNWDYYSVIYGAVSVGVVGIILEHSFHTNTAATKWLLDDNNLDKLARAEAACLAEHYGLKKATATDSGATVKATEYAKSWDETLAGEYTIAVSKLALRNGAGTSANKYGKDKTVFLYMPKGAIFRCYGYYTAVNGYKWLYGVYVADGITYKGFTSYKYLSKK